MQSTCRSSGLLPSAYQLRLRLEECGLPGPYAIAITLLLLLLHVGLYRRKWGRMRALPITDFTGSWLNVELEGDAEQFYASIGMPSHELKSFADRAYGVGHIIHTIRMDATQIETVINYPTKATVVHLLDGAEHTCSIGANSVHGPERYRAAWRGDGSLHVSRYPRSYDFNRSLQNGKMVVELCSTTGQKLVRTFERR